MVKLPVPTEFEEQCTLVQYLDLRGLLFSKVAQETFTRSWAQKAKNKASGLRRGLPDMFVFIPADRSASGAPILACIEMKRIKGGEVGLEQREWIDSLDAVPGVVARVCRGFEEARALIDSCLK